MAGEYRRTLKKFNEPFSGWIASLTLDYTQKRIYYIDALSQSIHSIAYDGGDDHLVIRDEGTLRRPFSISMFENHVYWIDLQTNSMMRANKWNGSDVTVIVHNDIHLPWYLTIIVTNKNIKHLKCRRETVECQKCPKSQLVAKGVSDNQC